MTDGGPDRHDRVAEAFVKAADLSGEDRERFLEALEVESRALRAEVESLLEHHSDNTLLTPPPGGMQSPLAEIGPDVPDGASRETRPGAVMARLVGGPVRRAAVVAVVAAALAVIGYRLHTDVRQSLLDAPAEELRSVMVRQAETLQRWIDAQVVATEEIATGPAIRRLTASVLDTVEAGFPISEIEVLPQYGELVQRLRSFPFAEGRLTDLLNRRGEYLYGMPPGFQITPYAMSLIGRAILGGSDFFRPHRTQEVLGGDYGTMYSGVVAPVRGPGEAVIAVLATASEARTEFQEVIGASHFGRTGEVYAFREDGVMISRSRFDDSLRAVGFTVGDRDSTEVPEWDRSSILNVHVRDPGGDVLGGFRPEATVAQRPLTPPAQLAVANRLSTDSTALTGLVLESYRNYRGVDVIGAWQWIPEHRLGMIVEVETSEVLGGFRYLAVAFWVLFGLLCLAVAAALYSAFSVVRLRMRLKRQRRLGKYTLLEEIGEGGMGKVYLARHAMLKRPTAVKVVNGGPPGGDPGRRFEREVQLASRLNHPNTIEVYDYGRTADGVFYYAMEYVPGLTLAQIVASGGPLPAARVVHILKQVCGSLQEAHELGLIHRDIKPANIMVCQRPGRHDVVKVLDFGLAKSVVDRGAHPVTGPALIGGTPLFMAPERIEAPTTVDHRTDIYSVGAVAYYLATGLHLFDYEDHVDLLFTIVSQEPRTPSDALGEPVDPDLEALILACLAKDPADRPPSIAAVIAMLERVTYADPWSDADAEAWWAGYRESAPV